MSTDAAERKETSSSSCDGPAAQDAPTPCRWRGSRQQSPAASTRSGLPKPETSANEKGSVASSSSGGGSTQARRFPWTYRLCLAFGFALVAVGIACSPWLRRAAGWQQHHPARDGLGSSESSTGTGPKSPVAHKLHAQVRTLRDTVVAALASRGSRAAVLDVLAGAPMEFSTTAVESELPAPLSRYTARMAAAGIGNDEEELVDAIMRLLSPQVSTWPAALRSRLNAALQVSPQLSEACITAGTSGVSTEVTRGLARTLPMQVDSAFTSSGARSSGWLHQKILNLGAAAGLSSWRFRASLYQSKPAAVVVDDRPAVKAGDCLALRGNASVALRIVGSDGGAGSAFLNHIVIEQPPRWALPRIRTSPRYFSVMGEPVEANANPYSVPLGSFEYLLAAPAVQAFVLRQTDIPLRGLQLNFKGPGWGEQYFCIYRLRAYSAPPPSCSGVRLAEPVALIH